MDDKLNERFVRWQDNLIKQSSYINNLIITLSSALLGFILIEYKKNETYSYCTKAIIVLNILIIGFSIIVGILGALTRLFDFKGTVEKIRYRKEKSGDELLREIEERNKIFGKLTWYFLYLQLSLFLFGVTVALVLILQSML